MKNRKNLPVAALRAFEAAARLGRLTAAGEELGVTHGAISRHVSHLEALIGVALFEGPRNRPKLTAEGRVFGFALTSAFDQIEDAMRIVGKGDDRILDVACLSTFAMRWLIPHLHQFTALHPRYDVRLATDDRSAAMHVDVRIHVVAPGMPMPENAILLLHEHLGLVVSPSFLGNVPGNIASFLTEHPRLETRTRPHVWQEWASLLGEGVQAGVAGVRIFDHYHLTIEAALNGLGAAVAPWHLVANDVLSGRLVAPFGFARSNYRYVVNVERPGRRKALHFVDWLGKAVADSLPAVPLQWAQNPASRTMA